MGFGGVEARRGSRGAVAQQPGALSPPGPPPRAEASPLAAGAGNKMNEVKTAWFGVCLGFWRDGRRGKGWRVPHSSVTVGWPRCPPARRWLIPLGTRIISKGWVCCRKKDKPTQGGGRTGPPSVNPSLGLERAEGAGADRRALGHALVGTPRDQDTAGLFAAPFG